MGNRNSQAGTPLAEPMQTSPEQGNHGQGSRVAQELQAAAGAAVKCSGDTREFVNESEAVLGKFTRALHHLKQSGFADEREILQSIEQKEQIVHFLHDCVRNRFLARIKVAEAKKLLMAGCPAWSKSFREHVKVCPTCRTVELERPGPPPPPSAPPSGPSEKWPIPFCLELLAICALTVPIIAWVQGDDCISHRILFVIGLLFVLLWIAVEVMRCKVGRARFLSRFVAGQYAVAGTQHRRLALPWNPTRWQPVPELPEGNSCLSFGWWGLRPRLRAGATVAKSLSAEEIAVTVTCQEWHWDGLGASLQDSGVLAGLPRQCEFDGSHIVAAARRADGQEELWTKLGCWRWDTVQKVLLCMAACGFLAMLLAAGLPPGLSCHPAPAAPPRLPLRAVFLLDDSGSVSDESWAAEKDAVVHIIRSFKSSYASKPGSSSLHVGAVRFDSDASVVLSMTNDLENAVRGIKAIPRVVGGTVFRKALLLCQQQLSQYTRAGPHTFDVCVLVTDGADPEPADRLRNVLSTDTALFGIFVGTSEADADHLQQLSTCGAANHSAACHFFARAANFQELQMAAKDVAEKVARGSDAAGGMPPKRSPADPWLPLFLLCALPFVAWWMYLWLPRRQPTVEAAASPAVQPPRQPQRLRTAGANEGRAVQVIA